MARIRFLPELYRITRNYHTRWGTFEVFLAELFNAVSLCIFQNNNHGYLVDTYNSQFNDNDTKKIFGKKSYLEFLFMSIASLIGGVLYQLLKGNLFLLTSIMMFMVFIIGIFYLPNCKTAVENNHSFKVFDKKYFALIFEKFEFYKKKHISFFNIQSILSDNNSVLADYHWCLWYGEK